MDAEDPRIAQVLEAKVLACESVDQIAADLGVSKPRVYQLLNSIPFFITKVMSPTWVFVRCFIASFTAASTAHQYAVMLGLLLRHISTSGWSSFGHLVRCYDVERTICDFLRTRNRCDEETVISAIKNYAASDRKDLNRLSAYAEMFKVDGELRKYLEVLL